MTSRTSLSPNSTAERTRSRSLSSRMPSSSPASSRASTSTAVSSSAVAGSSASEATEKKKRMKTVMGVMSQSSKRMGQTRRTAQRPRVRLKSSEGRSWLQKTTTSTTARTAWAISAQVGRARMRRAIKEDCAELERDDAERKLLQDRGAEGGVVAGEAELRLDQFFPGVEVFLHLAGEDLAELGVDAADVGGQGFDGGQEEQQEDDERGHGRRAFAGRF